MAQPVRTFAKSEPAPPQASVVRHKSVLREYAEALGIALALALVIRTFLVQAYKIPSGSMEPTLLIGDHILVNKIGFGFRIPDSIFGLELPAVPHGRYLMRLGEPSRGDVIVFVYPADRTKDFIKRIIGAPGDTVEVRDGVVFINGTPSPDLHKHLTALAEMPQTFMFRGRNFGPITVPADKFFVMGDNRDQSHDSRFWGYVDINDIEGRAMFIYWSWDGEEAGAIPIRWNRFGMTVN
ncbi:MAG: signal peptidase I [Candidatus Binataceae bacterium]